MGWLDYIPWWVWPILLGGGGVALFAFVPGALALVLSIYRLLPGWARWLIGGALVALAAYLRGRNIGRDNARREQEALDAKARDKAKEVVQRNERRTDDEIDEHLGKTGGFWDDDPPRSNPPRRRGG